MTGWDEALGAVTLDGAGRRATGLPVGLPMPRDRDLVADRATRVRVTRSPGRRFPFPVPNGWFVVAESGDLAPGDVQALFYFGRDLVLYRTEAGAARLVDAHCPHLGAHLAVGGKVEGDHLRCPFHGWAFDGESGACVDIPYGEGTRIPARAAARAYPTLERNGMVWAWHHAESGDPFYDVPVVPEFGDPAWSPVVVRDFEIAVPAQDMAENNVDYAHFRFVHGTDAIPEDEFFVDGTYKRAVGMDGNFVREGYGLGLGVLRITGYVTFISSTTPIDEESVHVRWAFTAPRANGEDAAVRAAESFCDGVSQDIPIWENKIYRPRPVLTRSERPIIEHRRWCRQFYSHYDPAGEVTETEA
jgi:nitrite reductase/ring-hydroxylating ferredoxin subunit